MTARTIGRVEPPILKLRIGFVVLPEFTLMALSGFIEALRVSDYDTIPKNGHLCSWEVMSHSFAQVRSSSGLAIQPTSKLRDPREFDYIVVVGGLLEGHDKADPAIIDYVRQAAAHDVPLIGACTGSFLLARAGLMEGRRSCVHQFHVNDWQAEFPTLAVESDRLFVVDGPRITCPGGASAIDVAIHLIQRHCGRERALKTVGLALFDEARSSNHPQGRTALDVSAPVRDPLVRRAILIMQQNISSIVTIESIAGTLDSKVKKLSRAFRTQLSMSPAQTYRQIRLQRALWLVEHTSKSMSEIAYECGFADASHFSRMFREEFDASPNNVRIAMRAQSAAAVSPVVSFTPQLLPN